jgi:hypothetical protein
MKIAIALPHLLPCSDARAQSFARLVEGLTSQKPDFSDWKQEETVEIIGPKVFSDKEPNWSWAAKMWDWSEETGADFLLTLQDDVILAAEFWPWLMHVIEEKVSGTVSYAICLHNPHPAAKMLYRGGFDAIVSKDMWIGVANLIPRELLIRFNLWRRGLGEKAHQITEDSLFAAWCLKSGTKIMSPIPTYVQHDVSVGGSLYGNDKHRNRVSQVFDPLPDEVLCRPELEDAYADVGTSMFGAGIPNLTRKLDPENYSDSDRRRDTLDNARDLLDQLRYRFIADNYMPPKARIFIATPHQGSVHPDYMQSILKLLRSVDVSWTHSLELEGVQTTPQNLVVTRSQMVADFLETDCTHLLFVDSDIAFPPELIGSLLALEKDIVCCPYISRNLRGVTILPKSGIVTQEPIVWAPEDIEADSTIEIGGAGLGMCLIRRGALERMTTNWVGASPIPYLFGLLPSPSTLDGKWELMSEDMSFFARARGIGLKVWLYVGPGVPVGHGNDKMVYLPIERMGLSHV